MGGFCEDEANVEGVRPTKETTKIVGLAMNLAISSGSAPRLGTMVASLTGDEVVEMEDVEIRAEAVEVGEVSMLWGVSSPRQKQILRRMTLPNLRRKGRQENQRRSRVFRWLHPLKSRRGWSTTTNNGQKQ